MGYCINELYNSLLYSSLLYRFFPIHNEMKIADETDMNEYINSCMDRLILHLIVKFKSCHTHTHDKTVHSVNPNLQSTVNNIKKVVKRLHSKHITVHKKKSGGVISSIERGKSMEKVNERRWFM